MKSNVIVADFCFQVSRLSIRRTMGDIDHFSRFDQLNRQQRLYLACLKGHLNRLERK